MALHIRYNEKTETSKTYAEAPRQWELDDRPIRLELVHQVLSISADGAELEYIRAHYSSTIPLPYYITEHDFRGSNQREVIRTNFPAERGLQNRVVSWFGDHAKFILANL